jgi:formate-dependent nitrite reductase membrane component NrfD
MTLVEHFAQPPEWRWYILGYFVLAGLAGGAYVLGTLLRLVGGPHEQPMARLCFLAALPLALLCPILLTADLGQPVRFWHMLYDTGVGGAGLNFKYWSPMSVGSWGLLVFGALATLSFLWAVAVEGHAYPLSRLALAVLGGPLGKLVNVVGSVFALFVAGYTGVLLSVSNQPVWSDTYALGGLFLASAMSGAAALVALATRLRPDAGSRHALVDAERYFALLELAFVALLFAALAVAGELLRAIALPWLILWLIALLSLAPALAGRFGAAIRARAGGAGSASLGRVGVGAGAAALFVLVGVVALRAAVLWSAQG